MLFFDFEQTWENAQLTVQTFSLVNYNLRFKRNSSSRLLKYCKTWSLSKTTNHIAIVTNIEYKSGFCTKIECWAEETRVRFGVLNYTKGCRSAATVRFFFTISNLFEYIINLLVQIWTLLNTFYVSCYRVSQSRYNTYATTLTT